MLTKKLSAKAILSMIILLCSGMTFSQAQTVKDIDGNIYKTVTIGKQVWMAENLKTTKLNDGTEIPLIILSENKWAEHTVSGLTTPGYCWQYDSATIYKNKYGAFYNGFTISTGKLCPSGWHVPSDEEWNILTEYLGGEEVAGGKLKETGATNWNSPGKGTTNETGFSGRGGGSITDNGSNWDVGYNGYWWSSTAYNENLHWIRLINSSVPNIYKMYGEKHVGYNVRCIK